MAKQATTTMKCVDCGQAIKKGWDYDPEGPRHFNKTHWPSCHDPRSCSACLGPGRKLVSANYKASAAR